MAVATGFSNYEQVIPAQALLTATVAVIGAGVIGTGTAWHLAEQGHSVLIADPSLADPIPESSSGRSEWDDSLLGSADGPCLPPIQRTRLETGQRSMALWPGIERLNHPETPLQLQTPLIQLASRRSQASTGGITP